MAEPVRYDALRHAGSAYFALKHQPPKQQPFLVVLSDLDDLSDERVLVDPGEIGAGGRPRSAGTSRPGRQPGSGVPVHV